MVKKHTQLVPILCVTKISTLYQQQLITIIIYNSYSLFPQKQRKISFKKTHLVIYAFT